MLEATEMTRSTGIAGAMRKLLARAHASESGAVTLLLMAAFLILFMLAMVMYDAGQAAQDKLDVQIAADSAAFSHSVIKARGMNMISYANTIKRMIYSFAVTYVNAWAAILARLAYHASRCSIWNLWSCITAALALPMVISEGIELVATHIDAMFSGNSRANNEFKALTNFQNYLMKITPWWAYIEGSTRAITNGAYISGSWPPPGSIVTDIKDFVSTRMPLLTQALPDFTTTTETLPLQPRSSKFEYCVEYAFSLEALVTGAQVYIDNKQWDHPDGWQNWFVPLQIVPAVGCFVAALVYDQKAHDFMIIPRFRSRFSQPNWWAASSALHIAYHPSAGRNDDDHTGNGRKKFTYMQREAAYVDRELYTNEGYFAMARSEFTFKQPFDVLEGIGNIIGNVPVFGGLAEHRLGLHTAPDMWSPRWKGKNRPLILPGEGFGSTAQGPTAGLNAVMNDTIPYLALGAILAAPFAGLQSERFTVQSALKDLEYLHYRTGSGFTHGGGYGTLQGLSH